MFRWLINLFKLLRPNRKGLSKQPQEPDTARIDTASGQKDAFPKQEIVVNSLSAENSVTEESTNETTVSEAELDWPELIKKVSDANTDDEINTIDQLVESLGAGDIIFKTESQDMKPVQSSPVPPPISTNEENVSPLPFVMEKQATPESEPAPIIKNVTSNIAVLPQESDIMDETNPTDTVPEKDTTTISETPEESEETKSHDIQVTVQQEDAIDNVDTAEESEDYSAETQIIDVASEDSPKDIDTLPDTSSTDEKYTKNQEIEANTTQTILINVDELSTNYEKLYLDTNDFDSLMESLCFKVRSNKLIGYDVLQIINNEEIISKIHSNAEHYLIENYNRSSVNTYVHKEEIIVSLVLIALLNYDGSLWDYVRNQYSHLYSIKSEQKTDRMIRQILAEYITEDTRYINYVIRHAIIPYKYLYDFITFAFDIYKGTLGYEIPDKLDYILANIYVDVSSMYETDSEQLQTTAKTYKLIKTTKDIIDNVQWFSELIAYTNLVLRYIDLHYWEDNKDPLPYSDYFTPVVDKWIENNRTLFYEERDYKSRGKSSWSASFSIDQTDIILHIANCIVRKENNPGNICINVVNDGVSYTVLQPKVTEEIGGYLVHGTDIRIANPLGELEYHICCGDKILYSTKDKLHRKYILFNENHSEIKDPGHYYGNLDIVTHKKHGIGLDVYYSDPEYDYVIAQKYVEPFDSIKIDNDEIYFYAEEKTSLSAIKAPGVIINSKHHSFTVYKAINYLTLITSEPPENLALQVNRENYHWKDWLIKHSSNGFLYKITLSDYVKTGFNEINILNWKNDNQIIYNDRFFYEPNFEVSFQPTADRMIRMNLNSSMISDSTITSDMTAEHIFDIAFNHPVFSSTLHMIVTPEIPVYRIDNKPWHLFDEFIFTKNLTSIYSKIYFDGIEPDTIKLLSKDSERILNEILIQKIAGKSFITIEKLLSVPDSISIASLAFFVDGVARETIDVFYRAVFDRSSLETDYDAEKDEGIIRFNIFGNDQIHVSVFGNEKLYYRNENQQIPAEIRIPNIDSFEKYSLSITGGKDNLFEINNSKQYEILSQKISFYNTDGIIKRSFTIDTCRLHYRLIDSDEGRDYTVHPLHSEIEVLRKISSDKYEVSVKQIIGETENSFNAEMELTSNITSGDFWCSIKCGKNWLKYDAIKGAPTNVINSTYMDILEYHVYYKKRKKTKALQKNIIKPESFDRNIVVVLPFSEERFNNCLSVQNSGNPAIIGVYLYENNNEQKKNNTLNGDILILKVKEQYYQCRLGGEKFRIIKRTSNGLARLRINAGHVYDFIPTNKIDSLAIDNLTQRYDILYKGNIAGNKNEIGYVYKLKK